VFLGENHEGGSRTYMVHLCILGEAGGSQAVVYAQHTC
jgi:hypothetical protein